MSELKITQEKVTAAFSEANDCPKAISILTALFGKQKPDYTDYHNIKTYEDACEAIGVKPIVRLLVEDEDGHKEEVADIAHLAYIKLCTIARALNNDPDFPRFTKDEYRYTPWFYLYNQKEIELIAKNVPEMCQRLIQAEKNVGHSFFPPSYIPQRFCKNKQYPYVEEVLEYVKEHTPDMFEPEGGYACMSMFHGLCE